MRKNTLIKLLAVLAMCFLIGAALVSCGEKEAEKTDVKTIVGVDIADGKLVIAYNDGTSANVALPEAEECEHKNVVKIVTEKHAMAADGTVSNDEVLNVCNDCHEAWVVYTVEHTPVDFVDEKAATCTEDGYRTSKKCDTCGKLLDEYTVTLPATGHDYTDAPLYWISGNDCEGGVKGQNCVNGCGEVKQTVIDAASDADYDGIHTVNNWTTVVAPTTTTTGTVVGTCSVDRCGATVTKTIGALPNKVSNDEYTFDTNSDMYTQCGDAADYRYVHNETNLEYHVIINATAEVKHELNGKLLNSADQVAGTLENAYFYDEYQGIVLFANHPLQCDEAVLAHFICTAVHDGGEVCGKDISIWVKTRHTTLDNAWVTVPGQAPACTTNVQQAQNCTVCGQTQYKTLAKQSHNYVYNSDVIYTKNNTEYVAGYQFPAEVNGASDIPALYYRGVCQYCGGYEYKALTNYKFTVDVKATCEADGEATITYKKASDGTTVTVEVVLAQYAHKTVVAGNRVDIIEGKENIKVVIYNADHADYKDLVKELDNVNFSTTEPVLGYIHCDCDCTTVEGEEACLSHDVTVWVQKLGEDGPATKAF